jgi:hypothetical protein
VLVGAFRHVQDFGERGLANAYVAVTAVGLLGMGGFYVTMEARRRSAGGRR